MGIKTFQVALSSMDDKLISTSFLRDCLDEIIRVLISIMIINTESAFNCNRYLDSSAHLVDHFANQFRIKHKLGSEAARNCSFIRRTAAIYINLIVAHFLDFDRGFCHFLRIVSTQLAYNRMLAFIETY